MVVRKSMDTESMTPAATRVAQASARGQAVSAPAPRDASSTTAPNAMMHTAQPATAAAHARPWWLMRMNVPENTPAITDPAARDAVSSPTVSWSPPSTDAPSTGNRTRGIANTMAAMSSRKVMRRFGRVARKRKPSTTERNPALVAPPSPGSGGSGGSLYMAHRLTAKLRASRVYAHANPRPATVNAPSSGPTMRHEPMVSWNSALAAGSWRAGTRRGTIAPRTGWPRPWAKECRDTIA